MESTTGEVIIIIRFADFVKEANWNYFLFTKIDILQSGEKNFLWSKKPKKRMKVEKVEKATVTDFILSFLDENNFLCWFTLFSKLCI